MELIKIFLEVIIIGSGVVTLIGAIMGLREWWILRQISNFPLDAIPIKKIAFCQLVIDWCHENISYKTTQKPKLVLSYYPHKKLGGTYSTTGHECTIYVNSHETVLTVINTVIHEYVHARQRDKNFQKMYDRYNDEVGYENNPFEIEARNVARKYEKKCLLWLCQNL
jgi:hypothetical protein